MDSAKLVKMLLVARDMTTVDLAKKLGCGTANLYNKYRRNNFSVRELEEIADATGCDLKISFINRLTGKTVI